MGIINGCFSFNNMSTYEESCSFAGKRESAKKSGVMQQQAGTKGAICRNVGSNSR